MVGRPTSEFFEWLTENGNSFLTPSARDAYLNGTSNEFGQTGADIQFNTATTLPPLIHQGDTRVDRILISVEEIRLRTLSGREVSAGSSETTDAEVVLTATVTYRVAADTYISWRQELLTPLLKEKDRLHLLSDIMNEELGSFDIEAPLFFDREIQTSIGYEESDIKSEQQQLKMTSARTNIDSPAEYIVRN